MTTDFAGKRVCITGGASGMGLATGRMLAAHGAHIAMLDLNPTDAARNDVERARASPDQRVVCRKVDVTDRDAVRATIREMEAQFGVPDIVITAAGILIAGELSAMPFEQFDRVIKVNLYGTRNVIEAVLPAMLLRGSGKLVLFASLAGHAGIYGYSAYSASKYAVVGLAECLRCELKPAGIGVACFCPGEVTTPMVAEERKTMHPATAILKRFSGTISTDAAVRGLIDGIRRDRFLIIPGFAARAGYWMNRLLPGTVTRAMSDALVARALAGTRDPTG